MPTWLFGHPYFMIPFYSLYMIPILFEYPFNLSVIVNLHNNTLFFNLFPTSTITCWGEIVTITGFSYSHCKYTTIILIGKIFIVNFCKKIDLFSEYISEYISGYISENISEYFLNNNLKNILKQNTRWWTRSESCLLDLISVRLRSWIDLDTDLDRSYFLTKKMRLPQLRSSPIPTQQHYDKSVFYFIIPINFCVAFCIGFIVCYGYSIVSPSTNELCIMLFLPFFFFLLYLSMIISSSQSWARRHFA